MGSTEGTRRRTRSRGVPRGGIVVELVAVLVVGAVAAGCWFVISRGVVPPWHHFFDLRVYRGAVRWWIAGHPLYDFRVPNSKFGFTYPPFAALAMLPMAAFSLATTIVIATVASAAAVLVTTWQIVAPVARRHGWSALFAVAVAVPLVCAMEPVRETFGYGQVNLLLAALVLADVVAIRRGWWWAGVGIGLATAVKLTPGLFIPYLLLTGRRRAAGVAVGTFLVAGLVGFVVHPTTSVQYWSSAAWDTGRVGGVDVTENQSLLGLLARLAYPDQPSTVLWVLSGAAVLAVGMWRAVRASRAGDELTGVTLAGLTGCLLSPISWTHHLYWVVPAVVVLVDVAVGTPLHQGAPIWLRARPRAVAVGAAAAVVVVAGSFMASFVWVFGHGPEEQWTFPGLGSAVGASAYGLLMLALIAFLPIRSPASVEEPVPADHRPAEPRMVERGVAITGR